MAGDDYVLSHTADAFERERLGHMESLVDLPTHRYLATLGIRQGWRCLEIGAGHGAVARWLAEQVGPQGRVVATDVDTRLLTDLTLPNVEVRQHDIRTDPLESGTYDLAHCRTLLMHMLEPHIVVRRMVAALRIGGWLLVEEPDFSSLRAVDAEHPLAEFFNRKDREISERVMAHSSGYNGLCGAQPPVASRVCRARKGLQRPELQLHHADYVCGVGEARQLTGNTLLLPPSAQGVILTGATGLPDALRVLQPRQPRRRLVLRGMRSEAGVDLPSVQSIGESWGAILQEMWNCNWPHKSRCLHDGFFA
jgi:SAM-dependent methyltransferase